MNMENLLDVATKAELKSLKVASKREVHKAAEATCELIGNKIDDKVLKPKLSLTQIQ